jgi:hypothetical protein
MMLGALGMDALVSDMDTWLCNGGSSTLRSYGIDGNSMGGVTSFRNLKEELAALLLESIPEDHQLIVRIIICDSQNYLYRDSKKRSIVA